MLRVTVVNGYKLTALKLEGRLTGPWADEAARAWFEIIAARPAKNVTVDLSGVTSVDKHGKNLLRRMLHHGSQLRGGGFGLMMKYSINRLMQEAKDFEKPEVETHSPIVPLVSVSTGNV